MFKMHVLFFYYTNIDYMAKCNMPVVKNVISKSSQSADIGAGTTS